MTVLYIDTKYKKIEVLDNITEQSILLFNISDDNFKTIISSICAEGISFINIPINIINGLYTIITINNLDELLTILQYRIVDRKEVNEIVIPFEQIILN